MNIRKATQSQRIELMCDVIEVLCQNTPVFEHAPKAKALLLSVSSLVLAPPVVRERVYATMCKDNPILMGLVEARAETKGQREKG